ncbi:MAG: PstS family phosphate ABC transporter substrate-binding protein [Phormidesmis sp. RL_2_1]|nr:PstS family phosphate ABC transporter substrate-binding protein [Phormidesmis sp. RL_2_1]
MSKSNNEIPALIAALGLTAVIVGGAVWWLNDSGIIGGGISGGGNASSQPTNTATETATDGEPENASARNVETTGGSFKAVSVPSGRFTYGGSTSWAPIRGVADPVIQAAFPNFKLLYQDATGTSDGIQKLLAGELDFAQSSRPLSSAEKQQAQAQGVVLEEVAIAMEGVAIATHPGISIPGLTLAQLKDIYTGQITNWSQVGGPNVAIVLASRGQEGGTVQFFQETVLQGQNFASNMTQLGSTTEALRFVSSNPGAIYFASAPEVVGQCSVAPLPIGNDVRQLVPPYQQPYVAPADCPTRRNQLNLVAFQSQTYPLTRPIYVVIRKDGQPAEQAGLAYSELLKTAEGGKLLQQAGFVPMP